MARKQYPSDHRPWFKMEEDILHHPALSKLPAEEAWAWVRLRAIANQRGTDDGVMWLEERDMGFAIKKRRADYIAKSVRLLVHSGLLSAAYYGAMWLVIVHKLSEIQDFAPAQFRKTPRTKTKKERIEGKAASTKPPVPPRSQPLTALPEVDDAWVLERCLPASNPTGRPVDPAHFRIWLAWCWNVKGMCAKGYTARGFKRAVTSRWWPNLNRFKRDGEPGDLKQAQQWYERLIAHEARSARPPDTTNPSPPISSDDLAAAAQELFA